LSGEQTDVTKTICVLVLSLSD